MSAPCAAPGSARATTAQLSATACLKRGRSPWAEFGCGKLDCSFARPTGLAVGLAPKEWRYTSYL